jgi:hypothetical protein
MKKVIVLNRVEATIPSTCCNLFKKVDGFNHRKSEKIFIENSISEKFNSLNEFKFIDGKVFQHGLYIENQFAHNGNHGVYRFGNTKEKVNYQLYFGPLIKIEQKDLGCKMKGLSCKMKGLSCKMKGLSCKSVGCSSKGGDNEQKVNFLNNEINEKEVSVLNKHFNLRSVFDRKKQDYIFLEKDSLQTNLSEYVKDNYDAIKVQFETDMKTVLGKGMGFNKMIDIPSYTNMFSQGLLFSSDCKDNQIALAEDSSTIDKLTLYLSRFDLWYFPKVKGLLRKILELLFRIPVIGSILKYFFGKKENKIIGTDVIEENNLKLIESIYENDFNQQEILEINTAQEIDKMNELFLSKIPVTIAVKIKSSFWSRLFEGQKYNFHTFMADGIKA